MNNIVIKFEDLERICIGLFGSAWKSQVANRFGIDRRRVTSWGKQGVPKWVYNELSQLVDARYKEVEEAKDSFQRMNGTN